MKTLYVPTESRCRYSRHRIAARRGAAMSGAILFGLPPRLRRLGG